MDIEVIPEVNLHTHIDRCGHASGSVNDYCETAIKYGMKTLGFSDHAPFPDNRYSDSRMPFSELSDYCEDIRKTKKNYPELTIYSGLETEFCPDLGVSFYTDFLLGELQLDYMIGASHCIHLPDGRLAHFCAKKWEDPEVLSAFVKNTILTMEKIPILYMAHPDCMGAIAGRITPELKSGFRDIIAAAADLNVPLEINANGFLKGAFETLEGSRFRYPLDAFWEIAAENGKVRTVIGMDAHTPERLALRYGECLDYAKRFGLQVCNRELADELACKKKNL